ncbi:hypothetical protein [Stieleria maiorica]|nr:hypothetical protein [Stieleria maiorica]
MCAQTLAVDSASVGRQVQCPKCQSYCVVPAQRIPAQGVPAQAPAAVTRPTKTPIPQSTVVACPGCQTKLSVKLLDKPARVACPKCNTQVALPARGQPAVTSRPASPPKSGRSAPVAAPPDVDFASLPPGPSDAASVDLGQLDVPSAAGPTPARFSAQSRRSSSGGTVATKLLGWIGNHKIVTAIVAINVVALLSCVFFPPLLVFCAIELPVGLMIAGATFLPRYHLVQKVSQGIGAQMAGLGAGGVLLLILAVGAKAGLRIARRANRNENLDFSGFDPSSVGAIVGSLVVFLCISALIVFLWKQIGIVRVAAAGYLLQMSLLTVLMIIGGSVKSYRDAEISRRHEESLARMRGPGWSPPAFQSPSSRMNADQRGAMGGPRESEIRIILMHGPNTDLSEVRKTFLAQVGNPECDVQTTGAMMTEWIVQESRDPQELADLIDFGRVLSVSKFGRTIRVGMPRVRPGR